MSSTIKTIKRQVVFTFQHLPLYSTSIIILISLTDLLCVVMRKMYITLYFWTPINDSKYMWQYSSLKLKIECLKFLNFIHYCNQIYYHRFSKIFVIWSSHYTFTHLIWNLIWNFCSVETKSNVVFLLFINQQSWTNNSINQLTNQQRSSPKCIDKTSTDS